MDRIEQDELADLDNDFPDCPICGRRLLGQRGYPLLMCLICDEWFEFQVDGSVGSVRRSANSGWFAE